jgi:hypothetical protein
MNAQRRPVGSLKSSLGRVSEHIDRYLEMDVLLL